MSVCLTFLTYDFILEPDYIFVNILPSTSYPDCLDLGTGELAVIPPAQMSWLSEGLGVFAAMGQGRGKIAST